MSTSWPWAKHDLKIIIEGTHFERAKVRANSKSVQVWAQSVAISPCYNMSQQGKISKGTRVSVKGSNSHFGQLNSKHPPGHCLVQRLNSSSNCATICASRRGWLCSNLDNHVETLQLPLDLKSLWPISFDYEQLWRNGFVCGIEKFARYTTR